MLYKLAFIVACVPAVAFADKSFTSEKTGTWDCGKDPDVSLTTNKATITLTGACKSISVSGNSITLGVESVTDLVVNGNKNTVTVSKLGTVTVNGNHNKVSWKAALSGKKPSVQNVGNGNGISKAKS